MAGYERLSTSTNPLSSVGSPQRFVHELEIGDGIHEGHLQDLHPEEAYQFSTRRTSSRHSVKSFIKSLNYQYTLVLIIVGFVAAVALFNFAVIITHSSVFKNDGESSDSSQYNARSIAFGSCSSYDLRPMTIWDEAIIPAKPDAWIWTGDFVYLDDSEMNCNIYESSEEWQAACNCTASWLLQPPYGCRAAEPDYASDRWRKALQDRSYGRFLEYMCPNSLEQGYFPPPGHNSEICPKPIFGIYDDHDFGWNNGYTREPHKREFKSLYLDAIGEDSSSPRRNSNRGAWTQYTLNRGTKYPVDVFLLDERYEREALPCDTRFDYCKDVVLADGSSSPSASRAWCRDFVQQGPLGQGSCCRKDEEIFFEWCTLNSSRSSPYFRYACDVTFEEFGMKSLRLNDAGELVEPLPSDPVDTQQDSSFCEVLGKTQRSWLRSAVQQSTAPVQLFVSGSVLFYDPTSQSCGVVNNGTHSHDVQCRCGGDNLDCYRVAQRDLIETISLSKGCAIVLTGDYHFADIKQIQSGKQAYSDYYHTSNLSKPIYQVMASGMSLSTAKNFTCEDFRLDPMKMRLHPECSFVTGPNFGQVILDIDPKKDSLSSLRLQIMSGTSAGNVMLEATIDATTCQLLSSKY